MSRTLLFPLIFIAGLVAMAWVGLATFSAHPLGVPVIVLIAACYLAGALELRRYRQATAQDIEDAVRCAKDDPSGWRARKPGERAEILDAISLTGGNLTKVAQRLGIARSTLYLKLDEHRIERPRRH